MVLVCGKERTRRALVLVLGSDEWARLEASAAARSVDVFEHAHALLVAGLADATSEGGDDDGDTGDSLRAPSEARPGL